MREFINIIESFDEDDEPGTLEQRSLSVIETMNRATASLPIRCEMRPFKNRHTGDVQGVVLTDLYADEPGSGAGTKVMQLMTQLADEADVNIYTDAEGPRSTEFYLKFGFIRDRAAGHQLVYYPPIRDEDED